MLVLITRAREDALRTAAELEAMGHQALLSPVIEAASAKNGWPAGVIDAVAATSAQAFEKLADDSEWPRPEARRLLPLFLVGARTREAAHKRGFAGPAFVAPDARRLAAEVIEALDPSSHLLYLAGRDRKPDLEDQIRAAGHAIDVVEVYEARAVDQLSDEALACFEAGIVGAVLHYSRRSATIFLALVRAAGVDATALPHICISADAATPLREAGFNLVLIAEKPEEPTMLALVAALSAGVAGGSTRPPVLSGG